MSTGTIVAIAIPALVVLAVVVAFVSLRRSDVSGLGRLSRETRRRDQQAATEQASADADAFGRSAEARDLERSVALERSGAGAAAIPEPDSMQPWAPPNAEEIGITRRQFLNRTSITLMTLGLSVFGAANLAFLWPRPQKGFGAKVKIGTIASIEEAIDSGSPAASFSYFSEAQCYIQPYPTDSVTQAAAQSVYSGSVLDGIEQGFVALWQKCPHLGCRVPVCPSSQWFECPCHGSQYNRVGEKRAGPAPRGMDRFPIIIEGGVLSVDTGTVIQGPAIGTNTTGQGLEGPHCA